MTLPNLIWLRDDLRLDDHPLLAARGAEALAVYCLDPRHQAITPQGHRRLGPHRAKFLLETLADLRQAMRARGGELIFRVGEPAAILPALAQRVGATEIWAHWGCCAEERAQEQAVAAACAPVGLTLRGDWGGHLIHPEDLPFPVEDLPQIFTQFRKAVERRRAITVRPPCPAPDRLASPPADLDPGALPTLAELGLPAPIEDPRALMIFEGGAEAGHRRLRRYLWETDALRRYKETRNGLLHVDDSSRLSPWLAHGALSPRRVYAEVKAYEADRGANESTYWLIFELLWRDFYRNLALQHGARLFQRGGIQRRRLPWREDAAAFDRWRLGQTGVPFVDAHMIALRRTGFMSNRGRQNVASYLARDLGVDWRWGAWWFEATLVDYDPASNWGSWQYVAGVGNDPQDRRFDIAWQAERYDPEGRYVRRWLRENAPG